MTAKKVIDAAWLHGPSYDLASQAAFALESAQLLQSPEIAAEHAELRTSLEKRTELLREVQAMCRRRGKEIDGRKVYEARLKADIATLTATVRAQDRQIAALTTRLAEYERPADEDPITFALTPEAEQAVDRLTRMLAPTQVLREDESLAVCRCAEPGADPYECQADDCTHEFSELNPFAGARPVDKPSAEVSRRCDRCDWRTSVWHVDDGSADEELQSHVARVHSVPETGGVS